MKILAIETSCDIASVSLLEDCSVILELKDMTPRSHSETLMPLIDRLFKETGLCLNDIDLFAVDNGPGSFTGIRIGLSTVKAFCDLTKKPCVSVSSLEALEYTVSSDDVICSMIDAKHGNVYSGIFQNHTPILDLCFKNVDELMQILINLKKKIFFVGNCGILYKDVIKSYLNENSVILDDIDVTSKYVGIASFDKFKTGKIVSSISLSALYLKRSSAEENV